MFAQVCVTICSSHNRNEDSKRGKMEKFANGSFSRIMFLELSLYFISKYPCRLTLKCTNVFSVLFFTQLFRICVEYKLQELVPNIEFELPFQWELIRFPLLCVLLEESFIYIRAWLFLL